MCECVRETITAKTLILLMLGNHRQNLLGLINGKKSSQSSCCPCIGSGRSEWVVCCCVVIVCLYSDNVQVQNGLIRCIERHYNLTVNVNV